MSSTPRRATTPKRAGGSAYSLLGVRQTATDEEIRDAYKKAVVLVHPDKPGGTTQKFRAVQDAYKAIETAEKRRKYNTGLRQEQRVRNYSSVRPKPLDSVKTPLEYKLVDGIPYTFETAPDQMKCKFRHGDVIQGPTGDQGVIIGRAMDGIYWMKNNEGYASLLCAPDFGGDRDIHILFRDKKPAGSFGAYSREQQIKKEMMEKAKQRKFEASLRRLMESETQRRDEIVLAVELYFENSKKSLNVWMKRHMEEMHRRGPVTRLMWQRRAEDPEVTAATAHRPKYCIPPQKIHFDPVRVPVHPDPEPNTEEQHSTTTTTTPSPCRERSGSQRNSSSNLLRPRPRDRDGVTLTSNGVKSAPTSLRGSNMTRPVVTKTASGPRPVTAAVAASSNEPRKLAATISGSRPTNNAAARPVRATSPAVGRTLTRSAASSRDSSSTPPAELNPFQTSLSKGFSLPNLHELRKRAGTASPSPSTTPPSQEMPLNTSDAYSAGGGMATTTTAESSPAGSPTDSNVQKFNISTNSRAGTPRTGTATPRNTESRAHARSRSSSAGPTRRATLTDRRSDLQKMLQEAKQLRRQAETSS